MGKYDKPKGPNPGITPEEFCKAVGHTGPGVYCSRCGNHK